MSADRYTIEVSAAELEVVSLALGRMPDAKPVRARKAATAAPAPFEPATGDPALDAYMRRAYKPADTAAAAKRKAAGMPKPAPLRPHKWSNLDHYTLARFNEIAVEAWRRLGHRVEIRGELDMFGANVTVYPLGADS